MKTITKGQKIGFPEISRIVLFVILLSGLCGLAIHSPAMAQSDSVNQGNSKEGLDAELPEPKKVKPSGPADEFNRGVPRSSLKGYLKAARDGDFERAVKYLDLRYLPDRMDVEPRPPTGPPAKDRPR